MLIQLTYHTNYIVYLSFPNFSRSLMCNNRVLILLFVKCTCKNHFAHEMSIVVTTPTLESRPRAPGPTRSRFCYHHDVLTFLLVQPEGELGDSTR